VPSLRVECDARREYLKRLALLVICSFSIIYTSAQNVLTIGTNDLPPYIETNTKSGLLIDLLSEVGREMNVKIDFVFLPWVRCEEELKDGKVWGIMPYVKTPEREAAFVFSDPLIMKRTLFFYYSRDQKKKINYTKFSDLKNYNIGGIKGYFYENWFSDAGLNVEYTASEEQNIRKLYGGRIDITPAGDITGWYIIKKIFPKEEANNFHTIEKPLDEGNIYIIVRRDDIEGLKQLKLFNEAMKRVKEEPIYSKIISEYYK